MAPPHPAASCSAGSGCGRAGLVHRARGPRAPWQGCFGVAQREGGVTGKGPLRTARSEASTVRGGRRLSVSEAAGKGDAGDKPARPGRG